MKFRKRKKATKKASRPLDKVSAKRPSGTRKAGQGEPVAKAEVHYSTRRPRGRPQKIPRNWVTGRAYNYRIQLSQVWPRLEGSLLGAQTEEEVTDAFENHAKPYAQNFVPAMASDILALIRHSKFPKRPEARINFLADSLGGRPDISLRTSRDICERDRAKQRRKSPHKILRHEFYVECSCGYKGPATMPAANAAQRFPFRCERGMFSGRLSMCRNRK